jgi:hypothetical protein
MGCGYYGEERRKDADRQISNEDERKRRFPGARKESSPIGDYWLIPESDVKDYKNPGKGRPRKAEPNGE